METQKMELKEVPGDIIFFLSSYKEGSPAPILLLTDIYLTFP